MTELSVFIPTLAGREKLLAQVDRAVRAEHPGAQVFVMPGVGSWGLKLNLMAGTAKGAYWLCCCDDTVPQEGWFEAGRAMLDSGAMPASRYFTVDGFPLHDLDDVPHGEPVGWCRSFLLTPEIYKRVGPFIDATWYADFDYSERLEAAGIPILACDGFSFTHLDGDRAWLMPQEDARQQAEYKTSRQQRGLE